jgi:DNA-binding SARP family transcriptional activator
VAATEPSPKGSAAPSVRLSLFGEFTLRTGEGASIRISARKTRGLLAYLALKPGVPVGRDRLAALLWGDSDDALARSSLRQALTALRRELPPLLEQKLVADNEAVTLAPGALDVDVLEFLDAAAATDVANLSRAVSLYQGEFLAGFGARSDGFDDWARQERSALRRRVVDALLRLSAALGELGDDAAQEDALRRLVALEPLDERPRRALMELHTRRGRHGEALDEYRRLRDTLRRELGVAPEAATEALRSEIVSKRKDRASPGARDAESEPPGAARPSVPERPLEELRDIAVVALRLECLSVAESGLDAEAEARLAAELLARTREAVTRAAGSVASVPGGDVLAVFGTTATRGDDALRASRVALELDEALRALEPRDAWATLKLALARGQVLGASEVLAGKPVAAALSLLGAARPGEILVTEAFARSLVDRLELEAPDPARGPFQRLCGLREPHAANAPWFVGREAELAQLESALASTATSDRGRVLAVRGEPGIGKTALLREFRARALARNLRVLSAEVLDFGQGADRGLLASLTLGLLGADASLPKASRAAIVREAILQGRAERADSALLCELVQAPLGVEARALSLASDPATHERARFSTFSRLLLSTALAAPLVLVLEDLHWASGEERALLGEIAAVAARAPLFVVLSSRPEVDVFDPAFRTRARGCPTASLDLSPLAEVEALALARLHAGVSESTARSCVERAEGLPLFLDQLLRAAAAGETSLPGSIRAVVLSRLDRLSRSAGELAFAAAVLGQRAARDALVFVSAREHVECEELEAAALIRSDGDELVFSHALFRDAVYESLSRSTRERLHARAADWFRTRDAALEAEHLAAANDPSAADAFFRAARVEAAAYQSERAARCAERGRALSREPSVLFGASCLLGEIRLHAGRILDAVELFREALALSANERERGEAQLGLAGALRVLDRHDEALEALASAERSASPDDFGFHARVHALRGNLYFAVSFESCLAAHRAALDFARRASAPLEQVRAEGGLGDAYFQRGHMRTARRHFERAVAECRRLDELGLLLSHLPMLALTRAYDRELDRGALGDALEAVTLAGRVGSPRAELLARLCLANLYWLRAEHERALEQSELGLDLARSLGARRFESEALGMVGAAELGLGRADTALVTLREACALSEQGNVAYCGPFVFGLCALAATDAAERGRLLTRGREILSAKSVGANALDFHASAIEVNLACERWDEVRAAADALERSMAEEPLEYGSLLARRARLLAAARADGNALDRPAIAALVAETRAAGFFGLLPALEAFL